MPLLMPRLTGIQVAPPSVLLKTPPHVPAYIVEGVAGIYRNRRCRPSLRTIGRPFVEACCGNRRREQADDPAIRITAILLNKRKKCFWFIVVSPFIKEFLDACIGDKPPCRFRKTRFFPKSMNVKERVRIVGVNAKNAMTGINLFTTIISPPRRL